MYSLFRACHKFVSSSGHWVALWPISSIRCFALPCRPCGYHARTIFHRVPASDRVCSPALGARWTQSTDESDFEMRTKDYRERRHTTTTLDAPAVPHTPQPWVGGEGDEKLLHVLQESDHEEEGLDESLNGALELLGSLDAGSIRDSTQLLQSDPLPSPPSPGPPGPPPSNDEELHEAGARQSMLSRVHVSESVSPYRHIEGNISAGLGVGGMEGDVVKELDESATMLIERCRQLLASPSTIPEQVRCRLGFQLSFNGKVLEGMLVC